MTWSQSYYLATWSSTKCFLHWHVIPTCWQPPYWSLVISVPLCCQSMFLMSFWLCNALRSSTHKAIFPDTVFNQSDSHWACFSFSKVVIFLMSWNPCFGVNACFIRVLCCGFEFWKDSAFQFHVSYGSRFKYLTFPCLCVCEPCFLHSSSFLSLPSSNPVGPVLHITGYPCTRSNHKGFVPLSKELLKESFWVTIRRKAEGLLSWEKALLAGSHSSI